MDIVLQGADESNECQDLVYWLKRERISGASFTQQRGDIKPGEMGAELIPIITAVLAGPAIVELVKSIHEWIKHRRPKCRVAIRLNDGTEFEFDGEGISNIESLAAAVVGRAVSEQGQ